MEVQKLQVKPSFFDDDHPENYQFWKKGDTLKRPSDAKVIEGILFKRSSRTQFWKSRLYVLFEDRLAYHKNGRDAGEESYCLMQNMRLQLFSNEEKDEKYGIRLIHNGQHIELFARAKDLYERWVESFSSLCVLTTYSSDFVNAKVIGKGSFAKVYLAKRKEDGTDLAVKTFDKNLLLKQDKARASLISEINIMRRLDNDNIISLYDVYESDNNIYLVLELLHGGELFDRIVKKGQYTEKDACTLMRKLLSALESMHSKGIMHRDIKPENLILKDVENDWNVKIADFGLATFINPNHEYLFKRCGTPGYVAPEVLADQKYDQKVDVFSCGVILYILLTGGSPFYGKSYNEILWKNKVGDVSFDFRELGHKISESAIDLMKKMLAKVPEQRITAKQALSHEWILSGGINASPSHHPHQLCSAQENMKKFQEENRFNVKNIKPKDLQKTQLERSGHAPSPLINGHLSTMASYSPDPRRSSVLSTKSRFAEGSSPVGRNSMFGQVERFEVPDADEAEADDDENSTIMENISKYKNGFTLISQVKDSNSSSNSSRQSTPLIHAKTLDPVETAKKAMNVQENLLGYLKSGQSNIEAINDPSRQKMADSVKHNLKNFQ